MTNSMTEVNATINYVNAEHKKLVDSFKAAQKALQDEFKKSAEVMFRSIFHHAPNLHMICWTQYTPYFNDGEECYFSRHEIYAVRKSYVDSLEEEDHGRYPPPIIFEDDATHHRMQKPSEYVFAGRAKYDFYEKEASTWEALSQEERDETSLVAEFVKTLNEIPEDILEAMFGNHVAVYVTRDGIEVEEYSHD